METPETIDSQAYIRLVEKGDKSGLNDYFNESTIKLDNRHWRIVKEEE